MMKTEEYKGFRGTFAEFLDMKKEVKIYHAELTKLHGDF